MNPESTDKLSVDTNPLTGNVIYRGVIDVSITTATAHGYKGSASVLLNDIIETKIINPVIFMYEYELFSAAYHFLTPVPYANFSDAGAMTRKASFNLSNAADGTVSLNVSCQSTTSIFVTMYYVIYSTRVYDGFIFNP